MRAAVVQIAGLSGEQKPHTAEEPRQSSNQCLQGRHDFRGLVTAWIFLAQMTSYSF